MKAFPHIGEADFAQACAAFGQRCPGRLHGTSWLVVEAKNGALYVKKSYGVHKNMHAIQSDIQSDELTAVIEAEDEDHHSLTRTAPEADQCVIDFTIALSPTYQVPVLWFSFNQHPLDGPHGIEAVYQYLVPDTSQDSLRNVGVMGGISMAAHPISELPAFFVHPCNTPEALRAMCPSSDISPEDYLLLWLGIVGPTVGLYVPSEVLDPG